MENIEDITPVNWDSDKSIIKVVGVGGGGCNAVTYMYDQKVRGCSFAVCNTDEQALLRSTVPVKIKMGRGVYGAGTDPVKGRNAALEAREEIEEKILRPETGMLFITAGLGGGTGTGAAPVIAKMSKEKGILTVAVVTLPFGTEGDDAHARAIDGLHELEKNVDSLLIINNDKLYEFYGDQLVHDAFPKVDEVLATAVRGITEIISKSGYINIDFEDVRTMMKDSGMALMGCGTGSGANRIDAAMHQAFESPLLNDFDLKTSKKVLINITSGKNEQGLKMSQLSEINAKIKEYTGNANNFKTGLVWDEDPAIKDTIRITAIATGLRFVEAVGEGEADLGNYINIDQNYRYDRSKQLQSGELTLPETNRVKIGFNTRQAVHKLNYADRKPALIVKPGEDISELENEAAIRRIHLCKERHE